MKDKDNKEIIEHLGLQEVNFLDFANKVLACAQDALKKEAAQVLEFSKPPTGEFYLGDLTYEPETPEDRERHLLLEGLRGIFHKEEVK